MMAKKGYDFVVGLEPTNLRKKYVQPVDINENFTSFICFKHMKVSRAVKVNKPSVKDVERVPLILIWNGTKFSWNLCHDGKNFQLDKEKYVIDRNIDNNPMLPDERFIGEMMTHNGEQLKRSLNKFKVEDFFNEIHSYFERYFYLEKPYLYDILTLFVVNCWVFDAHEATPYLFIRSPIMGCGKSHLGESIAWMCNGRMFSPSAKAHHIFRAVHTTKTVLVFDEIKKWTDNVFKMSDDVKDIISLVNAGFQKGGSKVDRIMNAGTKEECVVLFDSYSPKVMITTTGKLPADTASRCVELIIQRAPPKGIDYGDRWYEPARKKHLKRIREMGMLFRFKHGKEILDISENVKWRQELDIAKVFKGLRNRELEIFRPLVILTLKYIPEWKDMVNVYIRKYTEMKNKLEPTPVHNILWAMRSFYNEVVDAKWCDVFYDEWGTISIKEDAINGALLHIPLKAIAGRIEEQTSLKLFGDKGVESKIGKILKDLGFTFGKDRTSQGTVHIVKVKQLEDMVERYLAMSLSGKGTDYTLDHAQRLDLIREILLDNPEGLTSDEILTEIDSKMTEEQMWSVLKHLKGIGRIIQKGKVFKWSAT